MDNKLNDLISRFLRIANKWNYIDRQPIRSECGALVTSSEMHIVEAIGKNESVNVTQLAEILGITKGAISQTVANLIKKEMIFKSKLTDNKKNVLLSLTENGEKVASLHAELHKSIDFELKKIFCSLSDSNINMVYEVMEKTEKALTVIGQEKQEV